MKEEIIPYCKYYPGAFIEFTGLVTPCCWLVTEKNKHDDLKNFLGKDYSKIFITNSTKEEIEKVYKKIEDSWFSKTPFKTCIEVCGHSQKDRHPLKRKAKE
jgi:hypothetical protein